MTYEEKTSVLSTTKKTKHEKYNVSEKGRERYSRYRNSTKGILTRMRENTKRLRTRLTKLEEEFECIKNLTSRCNDCE